MKALLADNPGKMTLASLSGLGVSTFEALTVYVQFGIAVVSFCVITMTAIIKFRELRRK